MKAVVIAVSVAAVLITGQTMADGKAVYDSACAACHNGGVAGAPKFGDKAAWAARIKTGNAAMVNAVLKGKGAMPAKGGNAALSDADIKAAVGYMVKSIKSGQKPLRKP